MKFTIARADIESLLKAIVSRRRAANKLTLSACAARVFVECEGAVAGIEALVFTDGAVTLLAWKLRDLVKTYKGIRFLNFEGSTDGLRVQNFEMPVIEYEPHPKPPDVFQVFHAARLSLAATAQRA